MITHTYYKNKKAKKNWFMQIDGTTIVHGETPETSVTLQHANATAMAATMNELIMKKCTTGFEFDRVEQIETEADKKARTVGGVELAKNQFITDFGDAAALEKTLRQHKDQYHDYTDAVQKKGVFYGAVKGGKFVPHESKTGDNELDFYFACTKHPKLLPILAEFLGMIITADFDAEPMMRDSEMPLGANAAYALALADKKYLKQYIEFSDNVRVKNYMARFDTDIPGGGHVPALLKKWKFDAKDDITIKFLVSCVLAEDNEFAADDIACLMKEHGLEAAMKDAKFRELVYNQIAERAAHVKDRGDDVSTRDMGLYLFITLNALGIKCSKQDAMIYATEMEDSYSYPTLAQLTRGNLNPDKDDFAFVQGRDDDENSDDDDDDDDDDKD